MRVLGKWIAVLVVCGVSFQSCKEPYEPTYDPRDLGAMLIVEGYINAMGNESTYTLSYSMPMSGQLPEGRNQPVLNALVAIESEDGAIYESQMHDEEGDYRVIHPQLDPEGRYRLRIYVGQQTYLSDFVDVNISPAIGAVEWEENESGVQLYVSTEDPESKSWYYRWEYEETWKFFSAYRSVFVLDGDELRYRTDDEQNYICFNSNESGTINVATSEGLSEDVVYRFPFAHIPLFSEKLQFRYSILVKQRVMSKAAFVYWDLLRENSVDLGGIFGPMPTEIRGNIVNINDPGEPVIGMVEAVGIAEKRIYIDYMDLSGPWFVNNDFYSGCVLGDTTARDAVSYLQNNPNMLAVYGEYRSAADPSPTHYTYAPIRCVDCSLRGTLASPEFWED